MATSVAPSSERLAIHYSIRVVRTRAGTFEKDPMTAEEMVWMRLVCQAKYEKSRLPLLKG